MGKNKSKIFGKTTHQVSFNYFFCQSGTNATTVIKTIKLEPAQVASGIGLIRKKNTLVNGNSVLLLEIFYLQKQKIKQRNHIEPVELFSKTCLTIISNFFSRGAWYPAGMCCDKFD